MSIKLIDELFICYGSLFLWKKNKGGEAEHDNANRFF